MYTPNDEEIDWAAELLVRNFVLVNYVVVLSKVLIDGLNTRLLDSPDSSTSKFQNRLRKQYSSRVHFILE